MKYFIVTFGCQMNKSDSERIAAILEKIGYQPASKKNEADLFVVNMCSVRQSAVDRVHGLLPKFKKLKSLPAGKQIKTVLTGCVLKKDRKRFKKEFDLVLNIKDLPKWPKYLASKAYDRTLYEPYLSQPSGSYLGSDNLKLDYLKIEPKYQTNSKVLIPISNGCNNFCTYCVVPFTRGPLICRNHQEILKEVKDVIKRGFKEIWLLGQNVNDYHSPTDSSINFAKLLKQVNEIPGDFSIRFTSPHPKNFSDELINTLAQCKKFAKYINLPVQSGDNEILKKMNRPYAVEQYKNLVKKIREKIPEINLSTDVIVGFPGETKKQFENTVKLFKEIKFNIAYIARYSPRPGTAALKMGDDVPLKEKKQRERILREILEKQ